jgi:hypothetical protein
MSTIFSYFSVTIVKRKPCTTVVGTHLTAASPVNRNTGTRTTNAFADARDEYMMTPPFKEILNYSMYIL